MAITKRPNSSPKAPPASTPDVEALIRRGGAPSRRGEPEGEEGVEPDRPCMVQLRPEGWLVNQWDAVRKALDKKDGKVRRTSRHAWLLQVINDHAIRRAKELGIQFSGDQLPASER